MNQRGEFHYFALPSLTLNLRRIIEILEVDQAFLYDRLFRCVVRSGGKRFLIVSAVLRIRLSLPYGRESCLLRRRVLPIRLLSLLLRRLLRRLMILRRLRGDRCGCLG